MRYTTIIDISDMPAVYRNHNARLIYLHLALKSGYHDSDRDLVDISIRRLATDTGLTVSATRHALQQLEKSQLLTKVGTLYSVKKWIVQNAITPRARTSRQQRAIEAEAARRIEQERRDREDAIERERRQQLEAQGKTSFMLYYEGLQARAAQGDTEAARLVDKHRATYDAHVASMKSNQSTDKT